MADISLIQDECYDDNEDGADPLDFGDVDATGDEESLTPCAKLEKYAQSENIFNRQLVPSILVEIFRDASAESITADLPQLMDVINRIADDNEAGIRIDVVQRIPHLAAACSKYAPRVPVLGCMVVEHLLPLVVKYLGDTDNQVRKSTHATLLTLMEQGLVPRNAIETQVCPKVLDFTHADNLMDYHTGAVALMGKMVPLLGRETTERLFLQRFSELCANNMFYIRKICASSFGEFCAVVGRGAYENVLLPCFIELCADEIWGVRKACAEVVMTVSCACSPESRRNTLAPAFARLLQDQSRWVRMSAFQTLGPFISTFADPSIIGLAYNQMGELVLINPAGTEFRINSPAFTDANLKAAADFKQRFYQAQERIVNKNTLVHQMMDGNDMDGGKSASPFSIMQDSLEEKSDGSVNLNSTTYTNDLTSTRNCTNETDPHATTNLCNNIASDSVQANSDKCEQNTGCGDNESSETDTEQTALANSLTRIVLDGGEPSPTKEINVAPQCTSAADELDKYNVYQYWYISPDMPLDPAIVEKLGSPKKETTSSTTEESNFINRLDDIHFNSSWNPVLDESRSMDKTKWDETMILEKSLPTSLEQNFESVQQIVPKLLIDHFVSMTDPNLAANTDNDMAYHCAFSLPAVALTLGRNNWSMLKKTCEMLAGDMQYKIRKTVASSLHELALILGQDMAAEHLLPIFDGFIKDLDEVRIGVVKHLAHFLKLIGPDVRDSYLPRLAEFLQNDNEWNWRFREELANQLLIAVPLFLPMDASQYIGKLAQELLCDKVFAVRQVALSLVTELVRHVADDTVRSSRLLVKLAEEFAHSKRWVRRQAFALLCSRLISSNALPPEQFATDVLPHLLDLSWDPVPNVRLAVSRTISRDIIVHDYFSDVNNVQYEPVHMVLRRLQADKDRDVRQYAVSPSKDGSVVGQSERRMFGCWPMTAKMVRLLANESKDGSVVDQSE
ncbi:Protein phosphatase 2A at 29B [Carabus blaptoides fortunei]